MADLSVLRERARSMRKEPTNAERLVWRLLRSRGFEGLKFRRQVPLGPYIADFACFDPRVVVECDGGQHADSRYDAVRDAWFEAQGFRVLRFWNDYILREPEGLEMSLLAALGRRSCDPSPSQPSAGPLPLPQGERGSGGEV